MDVLPSTCAVLGIPGAEDRLGLVERLDGVDQIVVLLVDGMGYQLLPLAATTAPCLDEIVAGRAGYLDELTCAFPSTTPTNLVSLGTGAPPGEHGVLGFTVAIPGTDRVLNHVRWLDDPPPREWQPVPTWFDRALAAGRPTATVAKKAFEGSGLTRAAYGGARFVGADDVEELVTAVSDELARGTALVYAYHPDLDGAAHQYGIASGQWAEAAYGVGQLLQSLVGRLPRRAALVVTADHGGLDAGPEHRVDIGLDARLSAGVRMVAGEPRVRFLHTVDGAVPDVLAAWRDVMGDGAEVLTRDAAVESGLFGPVSVANRARIGDVVVICTGETAVMASGYEPAELAELIGLHGGLTPAETRTPLIVLRNE
jgi:hypothetical protein